MIGIAIGDVGLVTTGDLGVDLAVDVTPATGGGVGDGDVGVDLVELRNVGVQHFLQLLTHGVGEGDLHRLVGIKAGLGHYEGVGFVTAADGAAAHTEHADQHQDSHQQSNQFLLHSDSFLSLFAYKFMLQTSDCLLTLDTAAADACHNILTQEQEDHKQRGGHDGDGRHLDGIVGLTGGIREGVTQTVGDQHMRRIVGDQLGPDIGVPRAHHLQDGDGDEGGQSQRDHNLPQVLQIGGTVHLGGQIQLVGDLHEVLAQQVDVEHADQEGDDQSGKGVHPAETVNRQVVGDGEQLTGDHHSGQQSAEQRLFALKLQASEGKGGQHGDDQAQQGGNHAHVQGVHKQTAQIGGAPRLSVVAPDDFVGPEGGDGLTVLRQRLQGGDDHPVEGEQDDQSHQHQEGIGAGLTEDAGDGLADGHFLHVTGLHYFFIVSHIRTSLIVDVLLDDVVVEQRNKKDDYEQDQCRGTGLAGVVQLQRLVDKTDHRIHLTAAHLTGGTHILTEDTDDAGIFLKAADKAGDDNVGQHGGQQRHGHAGEHTPLGGAVHLGRVVVLLVDALQTAQQNEDLKGQGVPHDVHDHNDTVVQQRRTGVHPVDGVAAQPHNDVVDNTPAIRGGGAVGKGAAQTDHVKHSRKHHADGDGVGHVGQEEDGLQSLLQRLDGVEGHRNQQSQRGGDRDGGHAQHGRVAQALQEVLFLHHFQKVLNTELKGAAAHSGQITVFVQEGDAHGVDDGPYGKDQQQHNGGGEV